AAGLLWLLAGSDCTTPEDTPLGVDTLVATPEIEVYLSEPEPPRPAPKIAFSETVIPLPDPVPQVAAISTPVTSVSGAGLTGSEARSSLLPVSGRPGHAGGAKTSGQGVTFFQVAAPAQSVVYVIDRSASMGLNGMLAAAKR